MDKLILHSSLQAATTICPSGILFESSMKLSNGSEEWYVSNIFECIIKPLFGLMITICNPRSLLLAFFSNYTSNPLILIEAVLHELNPEEVAWITRVLLFYEQSTFYL